VQDELLPGSFVRLPFSDFMLNLRWPFLPMRGWIEQRIIKLLTASASTDDVVLLVDSDVQFVRPFSAETFVRDGIVRFYRRPNDVDAASWRTCVGMSLPVRFCTSQRDPHRLQTTSTA
jgi:hypothetical protein